MPSRLATVSDGGSDAAGNAHAQAVAAIEVIVLWLLLAVIAIIAGVKGVMPVPAVIAAVFLAPAAGFVTMETLDCYRGRTRRHTCDRW